MSILSGFFKTKRRRLTDEGYKLQSEWTSSQTVVMGDGTDDTNTLEKNCGAINGITDSLTSTSRHTCFRTVWNEKGCVAYMAIMMKDSFSLRVDIKLEELLGHLQNILKICV